MQPPVPPTNFMNQSWNGHIADPKKPWVDPRSNTLTMDMDNLDTIQRLVKEGKIKTPPLMHSEVKTFLANVAKEAVAGEDIVKVGEIYQKIFQDNQKEEKEPDFTLIFQDGGEIKLPWYYRQALEKTFQTLKFVMEDSESSPSIPVPVVSKDVFINLMKEAYSSQAKEIDEHLNPIKPALGLMGALAEMAITYIWGVPVEIAPPVKKSSTLELLEAASYLDVKEQLSQNLKERLRREVHEIYYPNVERSRASIDKLMLLFSNKTFRDIISLSKELGDKYLYSVDEIHRRYYRDPVDGLKNIYNHFFSDVFEEAVSSYNSDPAYSKYLIEKLNSSGVKSLVLSELTLDFQDPACAQVLSSLTSIESLDLQTLELDDSFVKYIPPSVKKLNLSQCEHMTLGALRCLSKPPHAIEELVLPREIAAFRDPEFVSGPKDFLPPTLKNLNLSFCDSFDSTSINELLRPLTSLESLTIGSVKLGPWKDHLDLPTALKHLSIGIIRRDPSVDIDTKLAYTLGRLPLLQSLEISLVGPNILDSLPIAIQTLKLPYCKLDDASVLRLSRFTNLKSLDLRESTLKGTSLASLPTGIEELSFMRCSGLEGDKMDLSHLKQLKALSFRDCTQLRRLPIVDLGALEELDLTYCQRIPEAELASILQQAQKLRKLNLSYCTQIMGNSLLNCSPTLRVLEINNVNRIEVIEKLILANPQLEIFHVDKWLSAKNKPNHPFKRIIVPTKHT